MRRGVRRHPQERFGVREWLYREERLKLRSCLFIFRDPDNKDPADGILLVHDANRPDSAECRVLRKGHPHSRKLNFCM